MVILERVRNLQLLLLLSSVTRAIPNQEIATEPK